jgi:tyrosyl-tRNA synthetase
MGFDPASFNVILQDIANDGLEKAAGDGKLKVYCGFDPTASSLHIGNLLGIIVLKWFQMCGHDTVGLLGGATGRVGDPSGENIGVQPSLHKRDSLEREKAHGREIFCAF